MCRGAERTVGRMGNVGFARRAITEDELEQLLRWVRREAPAREAFYLLGADCGLRRSEVIGVRLPDLQGDRLFVRRGKGGFTRWVPLTGRTIRACLGCCELRQSDAPAAWNYTYVGVFVRNDFYRSGVGVDLVFHSLRHRFAMKLVNSGMAIHEVQALLGHSDISTTAIYLHATEGRFDRAREMIEGGEPGGPAPDKGPTLRLVG